MCGQRDLRLGSGAEDQTFRCACKQTRGVTRGLMRPGSSETGARTSRAIGSHRAHLRDRRAPHSFPEGGLSARSCRSLLQTISTRDTTPRSLRRLLLANQKTRQIWRVRYALCHPPTARASKGAASCPYARPASLLALKAASSALNPLLHARGRGDASPPASASLGHAAVQCATSPCTASGGRGRRALAAMPHLGLFYMCTLRLYALLHTTARWRLPSACRWRFLPLSLWSRTRTRTRTRTPRRLALRACGPPPRPLRQWRTRCCSRPFSCAVRAWSA